MEVRSAMNLFNFFLALLVSSALPFLLPPPLGLFSPSASDTSSLSPPSFATPSSSALPGPSLFPSSSAPPSAASSLASSSLSSIDEPCSVPGSFGVPSLDLPGRLALPLPGPFGRSSTSLVSSSNFSIMIEGVTKSGITFCQKRGSSTSMPADLLSPVNLLFVTFIPALLSQLAVLTPSTTRVLVLLAKMLSISSAQNSLPIASSSSTSE
mmetsp:Transcript_6731/g.14785  ORF Transcript_6731/g.14785 Transcript_6731/m.14785 type:complete len:210 (+) Transcript_6731:1904-2533(+)